MRMAFNVSVITVGNGIGDQWTLYTFTQPLRYKQDETLGKNFKQGTVDLIKEPSSREENKGVHSFQKGINANWNASNLLQDLNLSSLFAECEATGHRHILSVMALVLP